MGMYDINTAELSAENFFAGDFPVVTDFGAVKESATIRKHVPIVQGEEGIEELTKEMISAGEEDGSGLDNLIGISADESSNAEITYYLTGEFFAEGITLPEGVTVAELKPAFRKLGIFIKEMKNYG